MRERTRPSSGQAAQLFDQSETGPLVQHGISRSGRLYFDTEWTEHFVRRTMAFAASTKSSVTQQAAAESLVAYMDVNGLVVNAICFSPFRLLPCALGSQLSSGRTHMSASKSVRIRHVGNWCIHLDQTYVESPFKSEKKDVEMLNYAQPFVDALRTIPGAEVISQPSWEGWGRSRLNEILDQGDWYPLLASRKFGAGKVTSWTTGASPHWGINLMKWKQYPQFWKQVFTA